MPDVPSSMRALLYTQTGSAADVLGIVEKPVPKPGHGEVLIKVAASGVNPHDTKKRSGWLGRVVPECGVVPHSDGAGTIAEVGAGVAAERIGERVFVFGAGEHGGTAADYVCVPALHAVPLPDAVSFEEGASLGIPCFTAFLAVLHHGPVTGKIVLVQGGAGAVGAVAVAMARWNGATVIATVSSEEKAVIARQAGADHVIDYRTQDVTANVMALTGSRGADLIVDVDFGANLTVDAACIARHGTVAAYSSSSNRTPTLPYYDFAMKGAALRFVQGAAMSDEAKSEARRTILALLQRGILRPRIAARFPLGDTVAAHELMESGRAIGNIVVTV
jgi:NADPH:quinone reductase